MAISVGRRQVPGGARLFSIWVFLLIAFFLSSDRAHAQTAALEEAEKRETLTSERTSISPSRSFISRTLDKLSAGFFNFSTVPLDQAHDMAAQIFAYNYLTVDYRISRSQKFSIRPVFQFTTTGTTNRDEYKQGEFKIGDVYLNYVDYSLGLLPMDIETTGQFRFYLPTSNETQDRGTYMRIRPWFLAKRRMTRNWLLSLHFEPDYYVQTRTAFVDERGRVYGNRDFGYETKLELQRKITRTFAVAGSVGHTQMWNHVSPANHVEGRDSNHESFRQESMKLDLSINMSLRGLFMVAGISQQRDLARPRDGFKLLNASESQYFLLSSVRF